MRPSRAETYRLVDGTPPDDIVVEEYLLKLTADSMHGRTFTNAFKASC